MKIHETAFHVINCHVPVCHAVVPSRKWTMWLFRYVIVISYKCSITSTEVAPAFSSQGQGQFWADPGLRRMAPPRLTWWNAYMKSQLRDGTITWNIYVKEQQRDIQLRDN